MSKVNMEMKDIYMNLTVIQEIFNKQEARE